jgi:hypothetical protein
MILWFLLRGEVRLTVDSPSEDRRAWSFIRITDYLDASNTTSPSPQFIVNPDLANVHIPAQVP